VNNGEAVEGETTVVPLICGFASAVSVARCPQPLSGKQTILFLTNRRKVSRSLTLGHNAASFPSLHILTRHFILSHHHRKKGEYNAVGYFERGRPRSRNFYYSILLPLFLLSVTVSPLLCLIYELHFITGTYV